MDIGIFAKVFTRPSLDGNLDAIRAHGIRHVQFNMSCVGLPALPEQIPISEIRRIQHAMGERDLIMSAMSGTFNMIHPNVDIRREGLERLTTLADACSILGTPLITLCTGTRDPDNMWRRHAGNDLPDAWDDLLESMQTAISIADHYEITLGIEPELSNVVNSARKARRLLDELRSKRVQIIMDGSNLLSTNQVDHMPEIFSEAFHLLGDHIVSVHAKDLMPSGPDSHGAAGTGVMNYDLYLGHLQKIGYQGPLILHTLTEDQVPASIAFLKRKLRDLPA